MKYSRSRPVNDVVKQLLSQGWAVEMKGPHNKHDKLVAPNGHKLVILRDDSDKRALQNWLHDVTRMWRDLDSDQPAGGNVRMAPAGKPVAQHDPDST